MTLLWKALIILTFCEFPDQQNKGVEKQESSYRILTFIACCMKSIAISRPNNSPATRVNLLIIEHAPKIASNISRKDVQTHTL